MKLIEKEESLAYAISQRVSKKLVENAMEIDFVVNAVIEEMVYHVIMTCKGHRYNIYQNQPVFRVSHPADWWQAFKDRWFPAWAKRRWPVRMKQYSIDVKVSFPIFQESLIEKYDVDVDLSVVESSLPWEVFV